MIGWDWLTFFCAIFLGSCGACLLYVFLRDSYKNLSEIKKNTNPEAFRDARSNRS